MNGIEVSYSIVQGWDGSAPGVNVSPADPLFVDPEGPDGDPDTTADNDYRLIADSPAIDSSSGDQLPVDEFDLDGDGVTDEMLPFDLDAINVTHISIHKGE